MFFTLTIQVLGGLLPVQEKSIKDNNVKGDVQSEVQKSTTLEDEQRRIVIGRLPKAAVMLPVATFLFDANKNVAFGE